MGCGASNDKGKEDTKGQKEKNYKEPQTGGNKPEQKNTTKKSQGDSQGTASAPAAGTTAAAGTAAAPPSTTTSTSQSAPESDILPGRTTAMPAPLFTEVSEKDAGPFIISCYPHLGEHSGLCIATLDMKTFEAQSKAFTDEELGKAKEALSPGLQWPNFFTMLRTAFTKQELKVSAGKIDIKLKQKQGETKSEMPWEVPLEKTTELYQHFIKPFPRMYAHRKSEDEGAKLKESDYSKKEAEFTYYESMLLAGEAAEECLAPSLEELRQKASDALKAWGEAEGKMAKTRSEIEKIKNGAPSHPLDAMYACPEPAVEEAKPLDAASLTWDVDIFTVDYNLVDVAVCLFDHYNLIETFCIDRNTLVRFWTAVMEKCHDNPYHGKQHAADCMIVMHHILQALQKTVKFAPEDVMSAVVSAGILDLEHEGLDNTFIKRAGHMLSMLYSDLYQNTQNNLTVFGELLFNHNLDIFASLSSDMQKDVMETIREALFIKANVQMKQPMERVRDFKSLVGGNTDWSLKDNIRHVITHAVRMCDWSSWGRPSAVHKKWMERLAEEFYIQGDAELSLGLAPSPFFETSWTTDRTKHDSAFAKGQVEFIDSTIIPLYEEMARLSPDLASCLETAKNNKDDWEKSGGGAAAVLKNALSATPKLFGDTGNGVVLGRVGPDGASLWVSMVTDKGVWYSEMIDEVYLADISVNDPAKFIMDFSTALRNGEVKASTTSDCAELTIGSTKIALQHTNEDGLKNMLQPMKTFLEIRNCSAKSVDRRLEDVTSRAKANGNKAGSLKGEQKALQGCIKACAKKLERFKPKLEELENELRNLGGNDVVLEEEDKLAIKVRNPLKAPLPPGVLSPPDSKDIDPELFKILKSRYYTKDYAGEDLSKEPNPEEAKHCNFIMPYTSSEFALVTSKIGDEKRQAIYDLLTKLDDWDFDVFELQEKMSGGISGEYLRNQPNGGSLFVTCYALMYKWQFMQKFNIDETTLINWLSIVEAGYHPNPYHNSMHAADVLHVSHYIIGPGGCKDKVRASDEEVFAALFAAAIHDYNHPGINNAFHVRSQNYLAVLFNDRSVNENIHASSVFELMRMDKFNILKAFKGDDYTKMRDDIVEFVLGTDMGLHAMILSRFKKRLELTEQKMHKQKADRNLAITMAVKMADISNCGRPQKLYHGWCNVIVDEFFQQGDRERLQGMPVSPFMDRYTTVMAKGQIGFMNYIVMPLFECMGEFLEHMGKASITAEDNKGFWQENEDW